MLAAAAIRRQWDIAGSGRYGTKGHQTIAMLGPGQGGAFFVFTWRDNTMPQHTFTPLDLLPDLDFEHARHPCVIPSLLGRLRWILSFQA